MANLISDKLILSQVHSPDLIKKITVTFLFAVITAVCAKIEIPVQPVPFTLQTLAVIAAGVILGARYGAMSQVMYLVMGISGIPVFAHTANFHSGFAALLSPTGGYLLAFPVAAFIGGSLTKYNKGVISTLIAFLLGEALILSAGMLFLNVFYLHNLANSFALGAAPFLLWTAAKIVLGAGVTKGWLKIRCKFSE